MSDSTPPADATADLTGRLLGDFRVLRRLGQGGMGQVYLAEQISLKRKVALKILKPNLAADTTALERFRREAENVARTTHANIVQVYAIGEEAGVHYMALEYVEGINLKDYLAKKGPPAPALAVSFMRQVAAALTRAAELGVIHRDIKPENILLTRKGEVKVADFGLSRCFGNDTPALNLTQSGVAMGTPLYMSPEQVQGKPVDARTDIYSYGATFYHLLAGQPPFTGDSAFAVAVQHVQAKPVPLHTLRPDLPPELCALVDRMMAKDPAERFASGREVLRELNRLRDKLSTTQKVPKASTTAVGPVAAPPPPASVPLPGRWRQRALLALGVLLAFLVGSAVAWERQRLGRGQGTAAGFEPRPAEADELFLRQEAELYANPGKLQPDIDHGLHAYLALALLYLEQRRWPDADRLFKQLLDNPQHVPEYVDLGRLGRGIVLAFTDQPQESLRYFRDFQQARLKKPRLTAKRLLPLLNHPTLRYHIAQALERDAVYCEAAQVPFPADLEILRKPQPLLQADLVRPKDKPAAK